MLGNVSNNLGINTQNQTTTLPSMRDLISSKNAEPTADSENLGKSGGVYTKINDINKDIHGYIPINN